MLLSLSLSVVTYEMRILTVTRRLPSFSLGQPLSLSDFPIFLCALSLYQQKTNAFCSINLSVFIPSISFCYVGNKKEGLSSLSRKNDGISEGETKNLFLICIFQKSRQYRGSERVCVNRLPPIFGENEIRKWT